MPQQSKRAGDALFMLWTIRNLLKHAASHSSTKMSHYIKTSSLPKTVSGFYQASFLAQNKFSTSPAWSPQPMKVRQHPTANTPTSPVENTNKRLEASKGVCKGVDGRISPIRDDNPKNQSPPRNSTATSQSKEKQELYENLLQVAPKMTAVDDASVADADARLGEILVSDDVDVSVPVKPKNSPISNCMV